jgi:DNA polymerase III subunit epsilon
MDGVNAAALSLLTDPELAATTFVVIDFEGTTPRGFSPEPIEVAAVGLRYQDGAWQRTAGFNALMKPPAHAPITPFDTDQTGISRAMVENEPPAGTVLARLDARLTKPPYLLVAHNAPTEAGMIYLYRESCPTLSHTHLLDTVRLARLLLPDLDRHSLDALILHLGIPRPVDRHRAMPDVKITITLFDQLMALAAADPALPALATLFKACGMTAKATLPVQEGIF